MSFHMIIYLLDDAFDDFKYFMGLDEIYDE